jgi:hypothetical protein
MHRCRPGSKACNSGRERQEVGEKKLIDKDASLLSDVDALVEPTTRGDPMSPLRWTCKSTYRLAEETEAAGAHGQPAKPV